MPLRAAATLLALFKLACALVNINTNSTHAVIICHAHSITGRPPTFQTHTRPHTAQQARLRASMTTSMLSSACQQKVRSARNQAACSLRNSLLPFHLDIPINCCASLKILPSHTAVKRSSSLGAAPNKVGWHWCLRVQTQT